MKKAMVIGASGGMGYALVMELVSRGVDVVAFARGIEKLKELFAGEEKVTLVAGDAGNKEELTLAVKGIDVIFHALNLPYDEWKEKLLPITQNIINAAEENGAKLAMVDNIYAYGKSGGNRLTENMEKNPHTKKGKLRKVMGEMIQKSSIPSLICHFPDFYGPNATNTYMHFTLGQLLKKRKGGFVGPSDIEREFIYTKDGAKVMVELALKDDAYGHSWNIPAVSTITGRDFEKLVKGHLGKDKQLYYITKPMFAMYALVAGKGMREAVEMQYINAEPTILSGEKLTKFLGKWNSTPYEKGIEETIGYMKKQT
ncbi:SDR family NAD(P)-dependent oxidoreductase [Sutcliffiella horikoshii]|uniref:SDR family NAD(P)-dependent oxidoreductase n=1 Tax=Sutcliffiella horikoshii TaxID=79883 RepID=A0A5D4SW68_9BACI|nr:SDR family NAD(P)-dependent oxidoreductase [Sutcliffiella horikoshii]TYS67620.1 SDR family NAD(P)-dependent oxidoreductase [Sutcliffiella horikoshii]